MMNSQDTYAGEKPMLNNNLDAMEYARKTYGKMKCDCDSYKKDGTCFCPGKSLDGEMGGRNANYSEIIEEAPVFE